jgi:two-component system, chemotaxis family, sensor kinase CheA
MPDSSYLKLFLSESEEYLGSISNCLVKLETKPSDPAPLNEIFRCVHTLKGMSATMGYEQLAQLSHSLEDLLDELRTKRKKLTTEIMDTLFAAVDMIGELFGDIKAKKESAVDISAISNRLKGFLCAPESPAAGGAREPQEKCPFTAGELKRIREGMQKELHHLLLLHVTLSEDCVMKEARPFLVLAELKRCGEVLKTEPPVEDIKEGRFGLSFNVYALSKEPADIVRRKISTIPEIAEVACSPVVVPEETQKAQEEAASGQPSRQYVKKIQNMRIPVERMDKIMNLIGELVIAKIRLFQIVKTTKNEVLEEVSFPIERLIAALQDEVMQTRLLPVAYILDAFPRVVRDVSRQLEKEVDLEVTGSEIELDRMVLDEISDPLLHLVRNAIDHGIESPGQRKAANKDPRGKVTIKVSRQKGQICIEVGDDGRGLDFEEIKQAALDRGLLNEETAREMDDRKVLDLLTLPGFSTSRTITDISGRGVGMDVVKSKIEALGGRVDFETKKNEGSRFILTLPLTLAIIKAMLVRVETEVYAIPLMSIRETIKLPVNEIKFLQNLEVVKVRDEIIPVVRLDKELGIARTEKADPDDGRLTLVIVEYGKKVLGLAISQIIGEQDIAVKPLGALFRRTKGIAGATILGDGKVALILDIMSLK